MQSAVREPQGTWTAQTFEIVALASGDVVASCDGRLGELDEIVDALAQVLGLPLTAVEVVQCGHSLYHGAGHQSHSRCELRTEHEDEHSAQGGRLRWSA